MKIIYMIWILVHLTRRYAATSTLPSNIRLQNWHQKKWTIYNDPNSRKGKNKILKEKRSAKTKIERSMICENGYCFVPGVRISMQEGLGVLFCSKCTDPHVEGSLVSAWEAFYRPPKYHIHGDLIYGIPNDGSIPYINSDHLQGNICMIDRGTVSFITKIIHAQNAGANGVIIVDDGQCSESLNCGSMGFMGDRGFGASDDWVFWSNITIPSVMISAKDGLKLKSHLNLSVVTMPDHGDQSVDEFTASSFV